MATIATLIVDVAANTAKLQTDVEKIQGSLDKVGTFATKAGTALAAMVTVGAITRFANELLDLGDDVVRVADRTGLLTDEVQKLSYIAGQSGNSVDEITQAIGLMQKSLESPKAREALEKLNINFAKFRTESPYQQFEDVATAIGKIEDPTIRAQRATDIFGKSGLVVLPTLIANFKELGDRAPIASEEVIRSLDDMGDQIATLQSTLKVWAANSLSLFTSLGDGIVLTFYPAIAKVIDGLVLLALTLQKVPGASVAFRGLQADIDALRQSAKWFRDAAEAQGLQLDKNAVSAQKAREAHAKLPAVIDDVVKSTKKHTAAIQEVVVMSAEEIRVLGLLAQAHREQAAVAAWRAAMEEAAYKKSQQAAENYLKTLPTAIFQTTSYAGAVEQVSAAAATYQGNLAGASTATASFGATLKASLTNVLQSIPGTLAAAFTGGGNVMGAVKAIASQVGSAVGGGIGFAVGGPMGEKIGAAIGSLAGPLIGAFQKLFGTAGRDSVLEFMSKFGSFDTLHEKLLTLGAAGEALWIKLTQGVGRSNPEQAKKVIEEINAAFAAQDAWMGRLPGLIEKYGLSWEQAGIKAKQAKLDEIARVLIQDFADLSKAGFDVTLITEQMSAAINDYVAQAVRTGTEIPAAMRPLLQKMIEMGTLTNAAGEKMTDLEGLTFATTLTEGFKSVVDAIRELTLALTGLNDVTVRPTVRPRYDPSELPPGFNPGGDPTEASRAASFHSGTARVLNFPIVAHNGLLPDEIPAILQTGEAVLNRRAAAALGTQRIGALNRGDRQGRGQDHGDEDRALIKQMLREAAADREYLRTTLPKLMKAAAKQGRAA